MLMVHVLAAVVNPVATGGETNETRRHVCVLVAMLNVAVSRVSYATVGALGVIARVTNVPPANVSPVGRCAVGSVPLGVSSVVGLKYSVVVERLVYGPSAVPFCIWV